MKNIKSLIIYGVIILLCIAAFGGYFYSKYSAPAASTGISENSSATASSTTAAASSESAVSSVSTASASDTAAPSEISENSAYQAKLIKDGNNITGKSEAEKQAHIKKIMTREIEKLDPNPVVGIGRGEDFGKVTSEAVKNAGGLKEIIKPGDVVLIKPNLCVQDENFGSPMTTDYRVVQEVINIAYECQASRVIIAEGNFASNAFENKENKYVELKGAELFNLNDCEEKDCYELKPQKSLVGKGLFIPKIYMDADVVIDVAKLKTHFITGVTLGLKNSIGIPSYKIYGIGGDKSGLHMLGIEEVILDLNKIRKPDFTIIDGIIGGENFGPYANTPVNSNIVLAGKDIVAVDTVSLTFMGFKLENISHIKRAGEEKLGISDLSKIKINGGDLNSMAMQFKPAF